MKKKIFAIALAASIAVLAIAGTSMAYFTDVEEATNVFTAGNVDIKLAYTADTETDIDADNKDTATALKITDENVYPGQVFERDATITNIGSETAYVGAIITLTNANSFSTIINPNGEADEIPVAIRAFITGLDAHTVKYDSVEGGYRVYVLVSQKIAKDGTVVLFNDIEIPTAWDNAEMAAFNGLTVKVTAYATQVAGFGDNAAEKALTTAFADWSGYTSADELPAVPAQNNG